MKKYKRYKIAILVLSGLLIFETLLLFRLWTLRPKMKPELPVVVKGKIAIVIDDWGYNLDNLNILEEIGYPLTASVLPNLTYSGVVAQRLNQRGLETILHLPMEPYEKSRLEQDTILTSMDEETIINIIDRDLGSMGRVRGVSNHMGSKTSEDLRTMGIIFKELKRRRLYFLDSLVSSKSVGFGLSRKINLSFAKRDVFLDNKGEPEYIKRQIYKLKTKAKFYGQAVGIGHARQITLEVLKEMMPQLAKEGYKFVFVSELVR